KSRQSSSRRRRPVRPRRAERYRRDRRPAQLELFQLITPPISLQWPKPSDSICALGSLVDNLKRTALRSPGDVCRMLNYTDRLTGLMEDVVTRVPTLSFINIEDLLVFARSGRTNAEGAFATCHCLSLPPSEPGYYFWRDRTTQALTRRSEWFVTKSPSVTIGGRDVKYMLSFTLPRFCDQSIDRSRKERFYPGAEPWMAKLDTVIHELYHIDPELAGIRRIEKEDGTY